MGRVVLDTSILIDLERGRLPLKTIFNPTDDYFVSEIAIAEFLVGIELSSSQKFRERKYKFLEELEEIITTKPFDRDHASEYAKLTAQSTREGIVRGTYDLAIAACAVHLAAVLYTRDKRARFDKLLGLTVKEF